MKALELVELDNLDLATAFLKTDAHGSWLEAVALEGMRALEKWRKGKCTDTTHSIFKGELRIQRRWCNLCQEELRKALEMNHD